MNERSDPERSGNAGGDSDGFDPDAWFEAQFGSRPPVSPSSSPHPPVPPVHPPVDSSTAAMGAAGMNESARHSNREPADVPTDLADIPTQPSAIVPPPVLPPPAVPPVLPPDAASPDAASPVLPPPAVSPVLPPPAIPPVLPISASFFAPGANAPTEAVPASDLMGDAATELLRQPGPPGVGDAPIDGDVDGGALDDVFGADKFREYPSETLLRPNRATPRQAELPTSAVPPAALPLTMGPGVAGLARDTSGGLQVPGYYDIGERGDPVRSPAAPGGYGGNSATASLSGAGPASATSVGDEGRASGTAAADSDSSHQKPGLTQTQKTLLWVSGGLLAVIALFALFLLGTRFPEWTAEPAPIVTPEPEPEPEPDPLEGVPDDVPLPEGVWAWGLLRGGECLDSFESPWAEEFTVVDCSEPHTAQLIQRAEFPEATEEFPGPEALAAPLSLVCSSPEVLNFDAASAYDDIEVQTAYPVTAKEWESGYRDFFCFITRAEGKPLEGSLVVGGEESVADSSGEGTDG